MYQKSKGIVLHTIKYSETSVIARIYTETHGLLSFIVKGVRSAKSKAKASMMQPLTILDLEYQYHENRGLLYIREYQRAYNYLTLPFDTLKSAVALLILEVVSKAIHEHETNEDQFAFIYEALTGLDKEKNFNPDFHLQFLVRFSRYLGFMPHDNFSDSNLFFELREGVFSDTNSRFTLTAEESAVLRVLMQSDLFIPLPVKLSRIQRRQALNNLIRYYQLHIENFQLRSPEILQEIMG